MKSDWSHLDKHRVQLGEYKSSPGVHYGAFQIPHPEKGHLSFMVIATDGEETAGTGQVWEHVSVHVRDSNGTTRTPAWAEMDYIKDLFWESDEYVLQFHVEKRAHVNLHPNVLHLWRPVKIDYPRPPIGFV